MTTTMSGRERVQRMFERRDHDRVPRHESFWSDTVNRWTDEGHILDYDHLLDRIKTDFHNIAWLWPAVFPGRHEIITQDAETYVVRDGQGKLVRYWRHKSGTPEHLGFGCDSREKWETIYKPALLASDLQCDPWTAARQYQLGREKGRWCTLSGVEGFEETRAVMGDEITMIAMAEDPEWVRDVSSTFTSVIIRNFDAIMATGIQPDGLWIFGDMAFKTATFCSPTMYRDLIWPDHKRLADWAHAHNMKFIYHTDGDVNGVMDLYLEAGFDGLQPLEAKANMDIRRLCPRYGDRMAFWGNVDIMEMATNDRARVEAEVRAKLAAGMATRGYAYHSDHSVPPSVNWDTYMFVHELLDQHGNY